jgi:hypothetical protein
VREERGSKERWDDRATEASSREEEGDAAAAEAAEDSQLTEGTAKQTEKRKYEKTTNQCAVLAAAKPQRASAPLPVMHHVCVFLT